MSTDPSGRVAGPTNGPHFKKRDVTREVTCGDTSFRTFLRTVDGVRIDSVYNPAAAGRVTGKDASRPPSHDLAFVIAHGFTGDVDRPHVRRVARAFARHGELWVEPGTGRAENATPRDCRTGQGMGPWPGRASLTVFTVKRLRNQ
ncbi:hypothetical protein GCM10027073_28380 [Streptomyces chlorus]|uniref:Uncharacterized protein n=1 Tax=Streptomyces chlorus TaxID=887452 RepID=A0ABW1E6D0_9ACTN